MRSGNRSALDSDLPGHVRYVGYSTEPRNFVCVLPTRRLADRSMTEHENEPDDTCVVCGRPIKEGERRFLVNDGAMHVECYEERQTRPASPQRRMMSDTAEDFIRREIGKLLRVDYRGKVVCSACLLNLVIERFGTAKYTRGQIGRALDAIVRSPGALRRVHRFVCDHCGQMTPCLTATPAHSGLLA